jgi:hypothetical protein
MSEDTGLKPQALGGRFKLGGLDAAAVARAEAALKSLSVNFDQWMVDELAKLEAARDAVRARGWTATTAEALYRRVHDIKGLGTTYGYPLVTRIGASLCGLLHDPDTRMSAPLALVDAHVDGISASIRQNIRSDAEGTGRELAETLEAQADRVTRHAA